MIKQTDVVLATYLVEHHFGEEETRRTFDYYDPLTTGDSTLSACVQSVVASAVGYPDAGAAATSRTPATVDLARRARQHRRRHPHRLVRAAPGSRCVAGFGGLRDFDGDVRFSPRLPAEWERLRFRVQVRGQLVEVDMTHAGTTYTPARGPRAADQALRRAAARAAGRAGVDHGSAAWRPRPTEA